jgi:acetolactate synthase I/II/III large subunit
MDFAHTAEALLALAAAHGSDFAFVNPGTDTFPLQEAWASRAERGLPSPRPIMCTHEFTAVSAAHGYFLVTGRPQTVFVHVDAGTLNAGGAISNAAGSEAGLVFCAGRAPYTCGGEMPGGKDVYIQWGQERMDQAGILRDYVKWHYELARPENVASVIGRAFELAKTAPAGPVYLTVAREVLMLPAAAVRMPDARTAVAPAPPAPDPAAVMRAARMLAEAERPLIVTGKSGRDPASIAPLTAVAQALGAPVADGFFAANLPASHPLNARTRLEEFLPGADVVLFVDPHVPYMPCDVRPGPDAGLIYLERDPVHSASVAWEYPADLRIACDVTLGLLALEEALEDGMTGEQRRRAGERAAQVAAGQAAWLRDAEARARGRSTAYPIHPEWLMWCLSQALPAEAIVLEDVVTNRELARIHLAREHPGTLFTPGGSCLGWGLNAAIGCKLGTPDRVVAALMGDGGFTFANPLAALWTAERAGAPILCVVFDNAGYKAAQEPVRRLFPGGAVDRGDDGVVTKISPRPDYAKVAEAAGALGLRLERPEDVPGVLARAVKEVEGGRSTVVHAVLEAI